jgi:hypothetical protein
MRIMIVTTILVIILYDWLGLIPYSKLDPMMIVNDTVRFILSKLDIYG